MSDLVLQLSGNTTNFSITFLPINLPIIVTLSIFSTNECVNNEIEICILSNSIIVHCIIY